MHMSQRKRTSMGDIFFISYADILSVQNHGQGFYFEKAHQTLEQVPENGICNNIQIQSADVSGKDTKHSWIVCAAVFICNMMSFGFAFTIGVYYIKFRDTFECSAGVTSLVASLLYGMAMVISKLPILLGVIFLLGFKKVNNKNIIQTFTLSKLLLLLPLTSSVLKFFDHFNPFHTFMV